MLEIFQDYPGTMAVIHIAVTVVLLLVIFFSMTTLGGWAALLLGAGGLVSAAVWYQKNQYSMGMPDKTPAESTMGGLERGFLS